MQDRRVSWASALGLGLGLTLAALVPQAKADPGLVRVPSSPEASAYLISPADGATVSNPIVVRFGLHGMGVAPAGVDKPGTGHHHLLIDSELPAYNLPIPSDDQHRHYGGGQTEAILVLPPGDHSLQMILGDARHIPHDPPVVSERIQITVE